MKTKRQIFLPMVLIVALFFGFVLLVGISTGQAFAAEEFDSQEIEIEEYYYNVNRSIQHFGDIMTGLSEGGAIISSRGGRQRSGWDALTEDNFAGAFIDEQGILNIGVLGLTEVVFGYGGQVVYRPQSFSWNYLQKIQEKIMTTATNDVLKSRTNEIKNRLEVVVANQQYIEKILICQYLVALYNNGAIYFIVDAGFGVGLDSTIYGGDRLNTQIVGINTFRGTATANAVCNETGQIGILTNEHVALNRTLHIDGWFGREIGRADTNRSQFGGTVDAAFVPFSNQSNWNTTTNARFGSTIHRNIALGGEELILTGLPVRRIGQTTGITTGTITSRNTIVNADGVAFSSIIEYSNAGQEGDSGGPLYFDAGNQGLFLIGMHFASTEQGRPNRRGYASRITEVMRVLNVTPITHGALFDTTNLPNNEVRIDRLNITWPVDPNSNRTNFTVPAQINGRMVTELGAFAFANQPNITNFILPSSLRAIGDSVFANSVRFGAFGCVFTIPTNVQSIGARAFYRTGLSGVHIPSGVVSIGDLAFAYTPLVSLTFGNNSSLSSIGMAAFVDTPVVDIPASVSSIGQAAFSRSGISSVTLGGGSVPLAIGGWSFSETSRLTRVTVPSRVASVGAHAFLESNADVVWQYNPSLVGAVYLRPRLHEVLIPSNITNIPSQAFANSPRLSIVTFVGTSSVSMIGVRAFYNSPKLTSIALPSSLRRISLEAFEGTGISTLNIPVTVEHIEQRILYNTPLWNNTPTGTVVRAGGWALGVRGQASGDVSLSGIRRIADRAFANQTGITTVTIPDSVEYIGQNAFVGANNLTIHVDMTNHPSTWSNNWNSGSRPVVWALPTVDTEQVETIYTQGQLMTRLLNSSGSFRLGGDIVLTGQWMPIHGFSGVLDGNGHTISGLNISRGGHNGDWNTYLGLFGRTNGTIKNLNITNATITLGSNHGGVGRAGVGLVAGRLAGHGAGFQGRVDNVSVSYSTIIVDRCLSYVGAIVGLGSGSITNASVYSVSLRGNGDMGGVVGFGYNVSVIASTIHDVAIWHWSVHATRSVGGVVGYLHLGGIHNNEVSGLAVTNNGPNPPANVGAVVGVQDTRVAAAGRVSGNTVTNAMQQGAVITRHIGGRLTHSGVV